MIAINLGVYESYLEQKIIETGQKRNETKDPYEQLACDQATKIYEQSLVDYKKLIVNQWR